MMFKDLKRTCFRDAASRELLYYPQAKIYDHTLLTKQSYAFDA